ncbi:MAG TPA: hypothetical protein VK791_05600 [bacterium]|jgi:hypothetical protein|nr:hypothetical protein [bacterium]
MRFFFILISLLATGAALADPPMKTVYSSTSDTHFAWSWPYHTTQTSTSTQTHPAPLGSGYKTNVNYSTNEDVSIYRFHNPQLTYKNEWGYFFPKGTRPVKNNGAVYFMSPQGFYSQPK